MPITSINVTVGPRAIVYDRDQSSLTSAQKTTVKTSLELENVDNTADADKPVSTAQEAADLAVVNTAASDATTKANAAQAAAIQRANHTGTQPVSTLSDPEGLPVSTAAQSALDAKADAFPATVTLDPTGANNEILVTAKNGGTAGNSLTAEIAIDSVTDRTRLSVTEAAGKTTVTSGDKRRMIVNSGSAGLVTLTFVSGLQWASNGASEIPASGVHCVIENDDAENWSWLIFDDGVLYEQFQFPKSGGSFPDDSDLSGTAGLSTITASPATTAQAVALDQASLSVTLANATGSDGSGALAAVAETSLTGGSNTITPDSIGAETPAGAQAKVDLATIYEPLAVTEDEPAVASATLNTTAYERIVVPDATVDIVDLPLGSEADVGRVILVRSTHQDVAVSDNGGFLSATVKNGELAAFRAVVWNSFDLEWQLVGVDGSTVAKLSEANTFSGQNTYTAPIVSTGTATAGNQLLNRDQSDARHGVRIFKHLTTADEVTVNNTTTPTDVPGLAVTGLAAGTYLVRAGLWLASGDNAAGAKWQVTPGANFQPNGSAIFSRSFNDANNSVPVTSGAGNIRPDYLGSNPTGSRGGNGGTGTVASRSVFGEYTGYLIFTDTGSITVEFAQVVATVTDTSIQNGSFVDIVKIA